MTGRGCTDTLRRELQRKNLGFRGVRDERFCISQWRWPPWLYLTYRFFMAAYVLFWLWWSSGEKLPFQETKRSKFRWDAMLTNWTYSLLTLYTNWHLVAAIIYHTKNVAYNRSEEDSVGALCCKRPDRERHNALFTEENEGLYERISPGAENASEASSSSARPAWYLCIVWILYSAVSCFALIVTLVYFAVLHDYTSVIDLNNYQVHAFNSLLVLLEHFVSAIPYRLMHVVYPLLYGLLYLVFSLYYWSTDHDKVVYPILDWNQPAVIVACVLAIGFVLLPLLHGFFFFLYRARMALFRKNV